MRQRGFTVIELLVTLAVGGILLALAVPSFTTFTQNARQVGQGNALVGSLNYARSETVKRDAPAGVTVCSSSNGQTCSGSTNWSLGWIVLDPAANVLQAAPALGGGNTMSATAAGLPVSTVQFTPSGALNPATAVAFTLCDKRGAASAKGIQVNSIGRAATSPSPGLSVAGNALACP